MWKHLNGLEGNDFTHFVPFGIFLLIKGGKAYTRPWQTPYMYTGVSWGTISPPCAYCSPILDCWMTVVLTIMQEYNARYAKKQLICCTCAHCLSFCCGCSVMMAANERNAWRYTERMYNGYKVKHTCSCSVMIAKELQGIIISLNFMAIFYFWRRKWWGNMNSTLWGKKAKRPAALSQPNLSRYTTGQG